MPLKRPDYSKIAGKCGACGYPVTFGETRYGNGIFPPMHACDHCARAWQEKIGEQKLTAASDKLALWVQGCFLIPHNHLTPELKQWYSDFRDDDGPGLVHINPEVYDLLVKRRTCDCGAETARVPHARWCSTQETT